MYSHETQGISLLVKFYFARSLVDANHFKLGHYDNEAPGQKKVVSYELLLNN